MEKIKDLLLNCLTKKQVESLTKIVESDYTMHDDCVITFPQNTGDMQIGCRIKIEIELGEYNPKPILNAVPLHEKMA